mgnify:CR=1 FL=1
MNTQLSVLLDPLKKLLSKQHLFLFIVISCILFSVAIFSLYQVLTIASTPKEAPVSTIEGFDQKTIDQIKNLRDSGNAADTVALPSPRPNPFVEK